MGYYDDINHDPREGCDCDLCVQARGEMDALADEHRDAAIAHQESALDTPAGTVAARRRHRPLVQEEPRQGSPAWWTAVERAVVGRDLAAVRRLAGAQDEATGEEVDVWVRAMLNAPAPPAARHELATVAGRARR